tara:strand:- start:1107 stop:1712 length:606 start_codon:yes stop_codon:yes gene_type:complete
MLKPKLLVIGHGRHGKDTVSEILCNEFKLSFISSSMFACKKFIYRDLKDKYNYKSIEECYDDRHNHRSEWYNAIAGYCESDPSQLGKDIFSEHDIYCGLRNVREFTEMQKQKVFDACIWVDRSRHLPPENSLSMTLMPHMAGYIIDNNKSLEDLEFEVKKTYNEILRHMKHSAGLDMMKYPNQHKSSYSFDYNQIEGYSHG